MKSVLEIQKEIKKDAETNSPEDVRIIDKIEIDQYIRQGDLYLVAIKKPKGEFLSVTTKEITDHQLAPGTTKGSRHILGTDFVGKVVDNPNKQSELDGPIVHALKPFTLTHPKHAHFKMPTGSYRVVYQRDFLQEEIRRVRD